jgi:hypothetical protein
VKRLKTYNKDRVTQRHKKHVLTYVIITKTIITHILKY